MKISERVLVPVPHHVREDHTSGGRRQSTNRLCKSIVRLLRLVIQHVARNDRVKPTRPAPQQCRDVLGVAPLQFLNAHDGLHACAGLSAIAARNSSRTLLLWYPFSVLTVAAESASRQDDVLGTKCCRS